MIKKAVSRFRLCTNKEVKIVISKKKQYKNICIDFHDSDFFHLAGLHKLKDKRNLLKGSKSRIFDNLINDNSLSEKLKTSKYYSDIEDRLLMVSDLQNILQKCNNIKVFSYKKNAAGFSKIEADYTIKFMYKQKQCYLFLNERNNNFYVCCSLIKEDRNFTLFNNQYKLEKVEWNNK